jgi:hypothetical protein
MESIMEQASNTVSSRRPPTTTKPGDTFGRLVAIERVGVVRKGALWRFSCDCGGERVAVVGEVRAGKVTSCGCRHVQHGLSNTTEYVIWRGMKKRCNNSRDPRYHDYGGRGISVCDRWNKSFPAFLEDMGLRPSLDHSLERLDNNKGYEPGNVVWATRAQQQRNMRSNRFVMCEGEIMSVTDAARRLGVTRQALSKRATRSMAGDVPDVTKRSQRRRGKGRKKRDCA